MTPSPLEGNALFRGIYCWLAANNGNAQYCTPIVESHVRRGLLLPGWEWLAYTIAGVVIVALVVTAFLVFTMFYTYYERRLLGRFQGRLGPNRTGPLGLLQPVADAIKLLTKEDVVPASADRWIFNIAPIVMVVPVLLVLAVLPFGSSTFVADLNIGVLFVVAVTSISILAMLMAGLASGNRYALFGGVRAVAQLLSYEVPVVLSIVGVVVLAGSLSLVDIVNAQQVPFILLQPLAFFIFVTGSSAEMNRTPFDLVEAESEIVAGYHTEYGGMKFGMFYLAEYGAVLTTSGIVATLFLKGWEGPLLPSHLWFLIKVFFMAFLFIWIRATLPRLRIDQVLAFAWKFLLPLSLLNIFVTAGEAVLLRSERTVNGVVEYYFTAPALWAIGIANLVVAVAAIVIFSRIVRLRAGPVEVAAPMTAVGVR